jgi:diguanylate cyclase (GGDEF)-like protein
MWAVAAGILLDLACVGSTIYFARANRKLTAQAERDGLTGLYNRRGFARLAEAERGRSRRHQRPLCLAFFDLDDFKRINDEMGHLAGDEVLATFARILGGGRASDVAARLGGDEFVLLMPETDRNEALAAIDRIRWRATLDPVAGGRGIAFTTGIAAFASAPKSVQEMLDASDTLLREAKRSRKSSVMHCSFVPRHQRLASLSPKSDAICAARESWVTNPR